MLLHVISHYITPTKNWKTNHFAAAMHSENESICWEWHFKNTLFALENL